MPNNKLTSMPILPFPLRPSTYLAQEQTIFDKLAAMNVRAALVMGVDTKTGLPIFFCDPNMELGSALYLLENARFRLMGRPPPDPAPRAPA